MDGPTQPNPVTEMAPPEVIGHEDGHHFIPIGPIGYQSPLGSQYQLFTAFCQSCGKIIARDLGKALQQAVAG